ncbi:MULTISPECIES: alpha/beta hydrolase [unclassified Pseudoalteromonas]|uniref:alpha/beta hydrolase n=1 Tax=unclassified Pseudoalteromonas TaxID=194690 RepID=UPI0016021639|nr:MULTISPECIES: alpha/beta hydrolase-fold protein [unclassified Pseudoalteromonas]MBB1332486.1 alpha/beta hydrolase [Pseudoalteromonas sp. SR41-6]MBB1457634.1 alpha/beta hydrolase [Pseudoalteromonas sp. SG41-8]
MLLLKKLNRTAIIILLSTAGFIACAIVIYKYNAHYTSNFKDITIYSQVLDESRKVFIRLPNNFEPNKRYSLIIRTDGNFNLTQWDSVMAELPAQQDTILVSIPNQFWTFTRNRDLVPPYARQDVNTQARPASENSPELFGQADQFLAFIEGELLPYLESHYKLDNNRVLSGYSAGGSFVLYTMSTKPWLFNGYFAFSPAAWYDDMTVVKEFDRFLSQRCLNTDDNIPLSLYITVGGAEHPLMLSAFAGLNNSLNIYANDIIWNRRINEGLEHRENPVHSVKQALDFYNSSIN